VLAEPDFFWSPDEVDGTELFNIVLADGLFDLLLLVDG
jgi:hypothetical protein